ncbi:hypothetical protein M0638_20765 [Roseomonas sp. NAR14]|uniref:Uncharacterized protein n=1 Tax=Roseomonas acroporae TaxID=2937791 RepID=A0A9X2BVM1_9PROT|nr:hypothetical protein [Roseomonas acroporae]MCK8786808.1 hypothetical protein [Roseomonas acroporae]
MPPAAPPAATASTITTIGDHRHRPSRPPAIAAIGTVASRRQAVRRLPADPRHRGVPPAVLVPCGEPRSGRQARFAAARRFRGGFTPSGVSARRDPLWSRSGLTVSGRNGSSLSGFRISRVAG